MIKPIVLYGDKILRYQCHPYREGTELSDTIQDLWDTMYNAKGAGLAAPQIGLSTRIFVIDIPDINFKEVFINPTITFEDGEDVEMEEACLSLPGINAPVTRKSEIEIEYYDENWLFTKKEFSGLEARVIQHEYDHLDGVLWIDRTDIKFGLKIITALQKFQRRDAIVDYPII